MKLRLVTFPIILAAAAVFVQAKAVNAHNGLARELGLSKTQRTEMKAIRQEARRKAEPVVDQLKQNHQALMAAVKAGDASQIRALAKAQGELRGQALAIHSQARAQIYAGLTGDQRQKMDAIQAQRRQPKAALPGTN